MNPHRVRRPRKDGAALQYLAEWQRHVEFTERRFREREYYDDRWPCCDEMPLADAREALERLLHRDGRRAHRLRVAIAELDERFRAVTVERGTSWRSTNWWRRRELL
ncbi:MAG: hypothetical protein WBA38_09065 [Gordonia sp. (in: high G+C Gram-positive bacteria)]|uniref:hypothetical protein n=1 Tax=Gordonia sp. (in: high G+C Gram-positive bacteria) TaxID=84139 RepID=UPI003C772DE1